MLIEPTDIEAQLLQPQLRKYLALRLPEQMIPSDWTVVQQMPLTALEKMNECAP